VIWICGAGLPAWRRFVSRSVFSCRLSRIFLNILMQNSMDDDYIMERFGLDCYLNNDNVYCLKDKGKDKDLFQTSSRHSWFLPSWRDV